MTQFADAPAAGEKPFWAPVIAVVLSLTTLSAPAWLWLWNDSHSQLRSHRANEPMYNTLP